MVLPSEVMSSSSDQSNQDKLRSRVSPGGRAEMLTRALSNVSSTRPVQADVVNRQATGGAVNQTLFAG